MQCGEYSVCMSLEPLALEQIQGLLTPTTTILFPQIQIFNQLPSTNQWLLEHGQCSDVCLTKAANGWARAAVGVCGDSPAGLNIYLSLKYCFAAIPEHLGMLGLLRQRPKLNWTNPAAREGGAEGAGFVAGPGAFHKPPSGGFSL